MDDQPSDERERRFFVVSGDQTDNSKGGSKPRLLIFVIAYYAESTLKRVLERIPPSLFTTYDCEVLVVDDASADRTFSIGTEYRDSHPDVRMTVLRNEYNQGYGGNQKVGYTYAIVERFDFVAMLHGDGQYAPEELPRLLEPLRCGEADAVFGSRMMKRFAALRGGMPLYKYVGNKILTMSENFLLRSKFSEFHSGYRVYSVRMLKRLPFNLNTNDFHFDTEIIIQLLNTKARIVEIPIPTFYGDEICRVDGMRYAKDVMLATLKNVAHRLGIFYQRRFDTMGDTHTHYDLKLGYASSHTAALQTVPIGARVLAIGSETGGLAQLLVGKHCDVTVVDHLQPMKSVEGVRVFVQDLDEPLAFDAGQFNLLLMLDIVEHLGDPERFLERLRAQFGHDPKTLILTTPNIAFFPNRLMLLLGQFNYGKAGILDKTHTRLFTFRSTRQLLIDAGFRIKETRGIPAPFPKALGNGPWGRWALKVNSGLIRLFPTLFSYQVFIRAESTPDVQFVLRDTKQRSEERAKAFKDNQER